MAAKSQTRQIQTMSDGQAHQRESNGTGAFDPARQQAVRWATTLLKSENAEPAHLRLQALRFIESKGFAPSDDAWDLARFLSTEGAIGDPYNQLPTFRAAREQMAEVALGQFARTFFELNPEERASRFRELREQWGDCPRAEFYLRQLSPGLRIDVSVSKKESALVSELAESAAQLFVLRPVDRAQRRYEILGSMGPRVREAEKAAQRIMKHYPEIANLAPDVIPALAKHSRTMAAAKKPKVIRRNRVAVKRKVGPWSWGWILIPVVLGLLRGLTDSRDTSNPVYTPQRFVPYSPPQFVQRPTYEQRYQDIREPAMRDYYSRQDQSQDVSPHAQASPSRQWPPNRDATPASDPFDYQKIMTEARQAKRNEKPRPTTKPDVQFEPLPGSFGQPDESK
jgi:hypothetical protein